MSTILSSPDGKRRCDAVCHNAKHAKCACICGGHYHGANVIAAKNAVRREIEEIVLAKTTRVVEQPSDAATENQPSIFGEENVS